MNDSNELIIRPATEADPAFALSLVPRLRSFGEVPLRAAADLDAAERRTLDKAFDELPAGAVLLVAEHPRDGALGFAYAVTTTDHFSQMVHGHLAIIAVAEAGEGRGVGRSLIAAVEAWALDRGYRLLTLNVFEGNARARALYERNGYAVDMLRCIKELAGGSKREGD
jgi:GNAT superfamily N-acetyltransferase